MSSEMTHRLAPQPRSAPLEAVRQLPRHHPRPPRGPSHSCSAASSLDACSSIKTTSRSARRPLLIEELPRPAPCQSSRTDHAREAVLARSWRGRSSNGANSGGAQEPAERSRQREEPPQQQRPSPALAVAPDSSITEVCYATPAPVLLTYTDPALTNAQQVEQLSSV